MTGAEKFSKKNLIASNCSTLGIYGTGLAAREALHALRKMNLYVNFLIDNTPPLCADIDGTKIVGLDAVDKDSYVLIAANPSYDIHLRLENAGIKNWDYVDPEWLWLYSNGIDGKQIRQSLRAAESQIHKVYDALSDDLSKKVLHSVLIHRMEHRLELIDDIYDQNQYFGNDVIPAAGQNFVDCGAFTGDTLKRYLQHPPKEYQYYAFEADAENYEAIVTYCRQNSLQYVKTYHMACYDEAKPLTFLHDNSEIKVSGKITDSDTPDTFQVQGVRLDDVLRGNRIDMITMDIEGAEIRALRGASMCIRAYRPKLAISSYHSLSHLWEIPLLVKELNPDYKLYFRHHQWNMHDTVCYAI